MERLTAVAAISENNVLAHDDRPPWDTIPADKQQYRELTRGHPLVFGENTYDNKSERSREVPILVLSYDPEFETHAPMHESVASKRAALEWLDERDDEVFVMGGGQIYRLFWEAFDHLVISHVPGEYPGDVFFPAIRDEQWREVEVKEYDEFTRVKYDRR